MLPSPVLFSTLKMRLGELRHRMHSASTAALAATTRQEQTISIITTAAGTSPTITD